MITALMFYYFYKTTKELLVKKVTLFYAMSFLLTGGIMFGLFLIDNQQTIVHTASAFFSKTKSTTEANPLQSNKNVDEMIEKNKVKLEAPLIEQLPELPRGCEVTALNMLLSYHGIPVDKMELAENIKRNPATFKKQNEKIYFGNPHNGFVGDMYSFDTPGLGVYHEPISKLAKKYAPNKEVLDFSGEDFPSVIHHLSLERPVWVIINSHYKKLPETEFVTWHTEDGPIKITYRQHSVLITGYDEQYIYFNDPLNYRSKAPIEQFIDAWNQMGKQAITIY